MSLASLVLALVGSERRTAQIPAGASCPGAASGRIALIAQAGLTAVRADDDIFATGEIIDPVWRGIRQATMLVAELTSKAKRLLRVGPRSCSGETRHSGVLEPGRRAFCAIFGPSFMTKQIHFGAEADRQNR